MITTMNDWKVTVCRTEQASVVLDVKAQDADAAQSQALEQANDFAFPRGSSAEYEVTSVIQEVPPPVFEIGDPDLYWMLRDQDAVPVEFEVNLPVCGLLVEDQSSSGWPRLTCDCCVSVVRKPFMTDDTWERVKECFKQNHRRIVAGSLSVRGAKL